MTQEPVAGVVSRWLQKERVGRRFSPPDLRCRQGLALVGQGGKFERITHRMGTIDPKKTQIPPEDRPGRASARAKVAEERA